MSPFLKIKGLSFKFSFPLLKYPDSYYFLSKPFEEINMKRSLIFLIPFLFLTFTLTAWDNGAQSFDSIKARAKTHNAPFIVYVRVDWCPWCKKMDAALEDSNIDKLFRGKLSVKINPEDGAAEKEISKKLGVKGFPSLYIILPNGSKRKLNLSGLGTDNKKLHNILKKQLDSIYKK
jgi:thiol-disulfide isomerase/thioredoxin